MDFFWNNVFEYFKERRYAAVFFGTLLAMIGALLLGTILYAIADGLHLLEYWSYMLLGIGLLLAGLMIRSFLRGRAARSIRYKSTPLSRDELTKARSKLKTNSNSKLL